MKRVWILIILSIVIIGALVFYFFNKPVDDLSSAEAEFSISAEGIFDSFSNNEAEANQKYLDKIIEVEGDIKEIVDSNGEWVVVLKSNDPIFGVSCKLSGNQKNLPKVNQRVKIKGLCAGFLSDVILTRCSIVKS